MATELERMLSLLKGCIDSQHAAKAKECILSIGELVLAGEGQSSAETGKHDWFIIIVHIRLVQIQMRSIKFKCEQKVG